MNYDYNQKSSIKNDESSSNLKDKDLGEVMKELNDLRSVLNEVYKKQDSGKKTRDIQPKNLRGIDEIQVDEKDRRALERLICNFDDDRMQQFSMDTGRVADDANEEPLDGDLQLEAAEE